MELYRSGWRCARLGAGVVRGGCVEETAAAVRAGGLGCCGELGHGGGGGCRVFRGRRWKRIWGHRALVFLMCVLFEEIEKR